MKTLHPTFSVCDLLDRRISDDSVKKGQKARYRLMRSAAELLEKRSFGEIRNIDISQNADIAAGMLNTYFTDKNDLVLQLLELYFEQFEQEFITYSEAQNKEPDIYVNLYDKIDYILNSSEKNRGIYRVIMIEAVRMPEFLKLGTKISKFWIEDLAAQIPELRAGVTMSKKERLTIARLLSGMVDDAIRSYILMRSGKLESLPFNLAEMLATLRYTAIFCKAPKSTSIQRVHELARHTQT